MKREMYEIWSFGLCLAYLKFFGADMELGLFFSTKLNSLFSWLSNQAVEGTKCLLLHSLSIQGEGLF